MPLPQPAAPRASHILAGLLALAGLSAEAAPPGGAVAARGRIRPKDGVRVVAGPSDFVAVVARLEVDEGQRVQAGQVLAVMDTLAAREARVGRVQAQITAQQAAVARTRAELENARLEHERSHQLSQDGIVAAAERDSQDARLAVAQAALREAEASLGALEAELRSARAERDLSVVRAPMAGQVLKVHARPGEKIGAEGLLELGRTDAMYAVAEVYETDVGRVRVGQRAQVRSPALAAPLQGTVEKIGLKVGRLQSLGTDPTARADTRVVEVEVRLDDSAVVAGLTHLEVEVVIGP